MIYGMIVQPTHRGHLYMCKCHYCWLTFQQKFDGILIWTLEWWLTFQQNFDGILIWTVEWWANYTNNGIISIFFSSNWYPTFICKHL